MTAHLFFLPHHDKTGLSIRVKSLAIGKGWHRQKCLTEVVPITSSPCSSQNGSVCCMDSTDDEVDLPLDMIPSMHASTSRFITHGISSP